MNCRWFILVMVGVFYLMLALAACGPAGAPAPTPRPEAAPTATSATSTIFTPVDREAIAAQLTPVATLSQAAEQLAGILETTVNAVKVRVEAPPKGDACVTCDRPPVDLTESEIEGIPVKEATSPLTPGSAVWLTVQDIVCLYAYDGKELKPVSVWVAPR